MIITSINLYKFRIDQKNNWIFLSIETDRGFRGWGEVSQTTNDTMVSVAIEQVFAPHLLNKNPLEVRSLTWDLKHLRTPPLPYEGVVGAALSGLDQALWDIKAQYFEVPLWALLGGQNKERIPCYANLNRALLRTSRDIDSFRVTAKMAYESGFSAVKVTPFDPVHWWDTVPSEGVYQALQRIEVIREVAGEKDVMVDFHGRISIGQYRLIYDKLRELQLNWIEEPIMPEYNMDLLLELRQMTMCRIAGGENLYGKQFIPLITRHVVDVVMPDVKYAGGISELLSIGHLASHYGMHVSFHNASGPISTAVSAHLTSVIPNSERLEFPFDEFPARKDVIEPKERVQDGYYYFSDEPGIGCHPSQEILKQCDIFRNGRWETQ
ncbi:MAG: mandelate racemase/muconate lactonizing enzyme family protein [Desulfitobacteriaceae bacterium]